jgi:ABC-type transporter Mla subunit MlaD
MPGEAELSRLRRYCDELADWKQIVQWLCVLGERQRTVIASGQGSSGSLADILSAKEKAYQEAREIAQRVAVLEEETSGLSEPKAEVVELKTRIEAMRESLRESLEGLAELESQARAMMKEQMYAIQTELESLQRNRTLLRTYGAPPAETPRFLDQRR